MRAGPLDRIQRTKEIENQITEKITKRPNKYKTIRPRMCEINTKIREAKLYRNSHKTSSILKIYENPHFKDFHKNANLRSIARNNK